jgi:hypothetical protein
MEIQIAFTVQNNVIVLLSLNMDGSFLGLYLNSLSCGNYFSDTVFPTIQWVKATSEPFLPSSLKDLGDVVSFPMKQFIAQCGVNMSDNEILLFILCIRITLMVVGQRI